MPTATAPQAATTIDPEDVARFSAIADEWWDPDGKFRPLHRFNPVRLQYIRDRMCAHFGRDPRSLRPFEGLKFLDVGCGGGLISEPLARMGASVTAIDASEKNIGTARVHAEKNGLDIDYRATTVEDLAATGESFDAVISMEVVEHVADVDLFLDGCAALMADRGAIVLATLNRTPKSFAFGIVGAEYIMRWLPRGTHDWKKFVRPSELARALRRNRVAVDDISGLTFNPLNGAWRISGDVSVNYVLFGTR
jgi:2-polyprenyl-6-hydroxyphenyl methylase/3-demethylubiquinone-9 3-methyltransferase